MAIRDYYFEYRNRLDNTLVFTSHNVLAKVYILEEDVIRVTIENKNTLMYPKTYFVSPGQSDIPFEGHDRFDISSYSLPPYKTSENEEYFAIETEKLLIEIGKKNFICKWYYKEEKGMTSFLEDRPTQAYNFEGELGKGIYHYKRRYRNEMYFGLGEKAGEVNRYGKRYRMLNVDPMGYDAQYTDPLYKHIPFYMVYNTESKYYTGIFYDNMSQCVFDMGQELDNYHGHYNYFYSETGPMDYYIIAKRDIQKVVKYFSYLTGRTIFPPKWALGYSGSTMSYTEAADADVQLRKFVHQCEENNILSESFQLSSGYTSIGDKRYVFNWNRDKIKDPKELCTYFKEHGIELCANIKPAMLIDHPLFEELTCKGYFIKEEDGNLSLAQFWDEKGAYIDFTNPDAIDFWKEKVKECLLEYGINSTWNDNNEFEIWSTKAKLNNFGNTVDFEQLRAVMPLLMMKASYEAQKEHDPNKRPYLISRSGCCGMQKYVQTWSGDNYTDWKTIKYNIKMGNSLSLSGIYNHGHDIGGFSGSAPTPELFVRWIEACLFYPRFTIHSWNDDKTVNEPWMYPEMTPIIRQLIKKRNRYIPYLYHLLYRAHKFYEPIIVPTFYYFSQDPLTYEDNDEYMVGENLIIAPVVQPKQTMRQVYLPKGVNYYLLETDQKFQGGNVYDVECLLGDVIGFAKEGSIIPINQADICFGKVKQDKRAYHIYLKEKGSIEGVFVEDDGVTNTYEQDNVQTIINVSCDRNEVVLSYQLKQNGSYCVPYDEPEFEFYGLSKRKLKINKIITGLAGQF